MGWVSIWANHWLAIPLVSVPLFVPAHLIGRTYFGFVCGLVYLSLHWDPCLATGSGHLRVHIPHYSETKLYYHLFKVLGHPRDTLPCSSHHRLPLLLFIHLVPNPIPCPLQTQFLLSIHLQYLFYFSFRKRFSYLPQGPCYLASLGLWIVAWLSCTLWLISTYKLVQTMHILLGLGYCTWDDIFSSTILHENEWCPCFLMADYYSIV